MNKESRSSSRSALILRVGKDVDVDAAAERVRTRKGALPWMRPPPAEESERSNSEEITSFRDKQNQQRIIIHSDRTVGRVCFWCMRPIRPLEHPSGTIDALAVPVDRDINGTLLCHGSFCTHNRLACVYAWLLREIEARHANSLYVKSLTLIHSLHRALYVDSDRKPLIAAADYRLLAHNGGGMSDADFDACTSNNRIITSKSASNSIPVYEQAFTGITRSTKATIFQRVEHPFILATPLLITDSIQS